ncbi:MAG: hypothetical protein AABX70_04625 [Nanoarchaeota archaeon]
MAFLDQYDHLMTIEKHILPQATCFAGDILEANFSRLNNSQKRNLVHKAVVSKIDPAIIGIGEHQVALRAGQYDHGGNRYYMCVKFQRGDISLDERLIRDVWLLGGDVVPVKGGARVECSYFPLQSLNNDSKDSAESLRSLGLTVPFTQSAKIRFSNRDIYATITEDLSEGGKSQVYPASEYLGKTKSPKLAGKMKDVLGYVRKRCEAKVLFGHVHGIDFSSRVALRNMFFVRTSKGIEELVANDFDHVRLETKR